MKNLAERPAITLVAKTMTSTVSSCRTVKIGEVISMVTSTTTSVTTEDAHWGIDWEIICRRVSMSLV